MINQSIFGSYSIQCKYRFFEGHKNVKESKGIIVVWERGLEVKKHCIHTYHITLNSPSSIFFLIKNQNSYDKNNFIAILLRRIEVLARKLNRREFFR